MTVEALISSIRYKVGDTKKTKWDDTRIIELINEGLLDISTELGEYRRTIVLPILPYQRELIIPDEGIISIMGVKINSHPVKLISSDEADRYNKWEEEIGDEIKALIYDRNNLGHLTIYPMLGELKKTYYEAMNSNDGVIMDIPNTIRDNLYGIITSVELKEDENIQAKLDTYGVLTDIVDEFIQAVITYKAIYSDVTIDSTLLLPKRHISALKYYVSGMLLFDDTRSEVVSKGNLFIQKYNSEIQRNKEFQLLSNQEITSYVTRYNTGFEDS